MSYQRAILARLAAGPMSTRDIIWMVRTGLRILESKGIRITDFDHKGRAFYDLKVYGNKAYIVFSGEKEE